MSPANDRVGAMGPEGRRPRDSGFYALRRFLAKDGAPAGFAEWSNQTMTCMVRDTLQDFILNQPLHGLDSDQVAVQYGITQGLSMALQLITDPSVLVPGIYGKGSQPEVDPSPVPRESFDTPADGVSDQ